MRRSLRGWEDIFIRMSASSAKLSVVFWLVLIGITVSPVSLVAQQMSTGFPLPDPKITPGIRATTSAEEVCRSGYSAAHRHVTDKVKEQVFHLYGITHHRTGEYEVDHLIPLELGGSNEIGNLWPESYLDKPYNAHVKDQLENRLRVLVCTHQLPLDMAQGMIAKNWVLAYQNYIGEPSK